jgi:hypothetical protein
VWESDLGNGNKLEFLRLLTGFLGLVRNFKEASTNFAFEYTANNFGLMYSRKRISQNSFPNFIYIIPKSFMVFCQELHNPKRNYENQI